MRRALVINCSAPHYNLGAHKLMDWLRLEQGFDVAFSNGDPGMFALDYDLVCLSVIFTWHAPVALTIAWRVRHCSEVWCGGPAMLALKNWWKAQTGMDAQVGLDWRFERQRGQYKMGFASRGCPTGCSFCLLPETMIQTDFGLKPISQIKTGDMVLTHKGRFRKVTETMSRFYSGDVYELQNGAVSRLFPTYATPEHPVFMRHVSSPTGGPHLTDFRLVNAIDIKPKYSRYSRDVSVYPRLSDTIIPKGNVLPELETMICNSETMTVIGWYLAEGYVTKSDSRGYHKITFCLGFSEKEMEFAKQIVSASSSIGLRAIIYKPKIGIRVVIHNVIFAKWIVKTFGTGASKKLLPLWIRLLPKDLLEPLIFAWSKGDGWYQKKKGSDTWKITTVSENLAVGLRDIAIKCGYMATINNHKLNTIIYGRKINAKKAYTVIFHETRKHARTVMSDINNIYFRIQDSLIRQYKGTVFNLEVEEDNSYCTASFSLHNCIVPVLEGDTFTLDHDFIPSPVLCDNNLSALPVDFQEHIIRRYQDTGTRLADANSGFEPRYFDAGTYARWQPVLHGCWRLAHDETCEADAVRNMLDILRSVPARKKQVYVLVGNEPITECYTRCQQVIAWGGEPYCQAFIPLNALTKTPKVQHDWTAQKLGDFCRFYNRHLWRKLRLQEYSDRQGEPPPFADFQQTTRLTLPLVT
jgi:hypothetical protein